MREIKFRAWDKINKYMFIIFDSTAKDWYLPDWSDRYEVMQYTGLHDKNGKEIWEGDILAHEDFANRKQKVVGVMEWNETTAGFARFYPLHKFEVIGNIYKNPKLLEVNHEN
jgi:YopX protein